MNTTPQKFIIGTRGSLLALTQCLQVKQQLESLSPHKFELKIIKTEGDENTSAPLWQLDGKDFFTKELDAALLKGEVDMVVHSYKDLGSERPVGIKLMAITKRDYPQDILFTSQKAIQKLQAGEMKTFSVGTSSPRRMVNLTKELQSFLPFGEKNNVEVVTKNLRGNVNTRLGKIKEGEFDAVVLALAGIERLAMGLKTESNEAHDKFGKPEEILKELIEDLNFMVLPTSTFPSAASQGALGIESLEEREDDGTLHKLLEKLNHQTTINEVKKEREVFQSFGGGCHLAVGINFTQTGEELRKSIGGEYDHTPVKELGLDRKLNNLSSEDKCFLGIPGNEEKDSKNLLDDQLSFKKNIDYNLPKEGSKDILVTSPYVARNFKGSNYSQKIWASGSKTMKTLAAKGHWVNGSADSLGEETLKEIRESHLVNLFFGKADWLVLTNTTSKSPLGPTLPVYKKEYKDKEQVSDDFKDAISNCGHFFWTSFHQYKTYEETFNLPKESIHYCGLGKTLEKFKNNNIEVIPMGSMSEVKKYFLKK